MDLMALLPSRIQFAFTVSFHIMFPAFAIGLAAWLTVLEALHLWTGQPSRKKIAEYVNRSLMLVTALAPVIGYDKASQIAHYAMDHDLSLREAALELGFVDEQTFDCVVDPAKMVKPYVAGATT